MGNGCCVLLNEEDESSKIRFDWDYAFCLRDVG